MQSGRRDRRRDDHSIVADVACGTEREKSMTPEERIAYRKEYQKRYRAANADAMREYQKKYRKTYYKQNKERMDARTRKNRALLPKKIRIVLSAEVKAERIAQRNAEYYRQNREIILVQKTEYYKRTATWRRRAEYFLEYQRENAERLALYHAAYRLNNKTVLAQRTKNYRDKNRGKHNASVVKRNAMKRRAYLHWLTPQQMVQLDTLYEAAQAMSLGATNYAVDHIVPLNGRRVCGLHVPWNLQVITAEANNRKHNRMPDELYRIWWGASGYDKVRAEKPGIIKLLWNE